MGASAFPRGKVAAALLGLGAAGFVFRAYPHLLLIPRWIIEESYNYQTVRDLVVCGASPQAGFYPMLEHQLIYWAWLATRIDPVALSQYANPLFGALTIIPLYYVLRRRLTSSQSLMGCALWAFSEAAFYRSAYFGSTEALGFLFSLSALAFYQRKNYIPAAMLLVLGALSHLLPTAFIFGVAFTDLLLKATTRQKTLIALAGVGVGAVFFSPLNPHQRLLSSLSVGGIVGGFGTFGIYSAAEILGGAAMFAGFLALGAAALRGWLEPPKNRLMAIYLVLAIAAFVFSWVDYQPNVFAPPRLTFYFLVPLIYYAAAWVNAKTVALICVVAVAASWVGAPTFLFTGNSLTLSEYDFLDGMGVSVNGLSEWWVDYPLRVALTSEYNAAPTTAMDGAKVEALSWDYLDPYSTMRNDTGFKYVLLTPRMEAGGLFFVFNEHRTIHIVKPVPDIWASGGNGWKLLKVSSDGIKLYERK